MRHVAHRIVVSIDTENTQHRANVQISVRWLNDRAQLRGATRDFNPFYSHWHRRKDLALGDFGEWHEATRFLQTTAFGPTLSCPRPLAGTVVSSRRL